MTLEEAETVMQREHTRSTKVLDYEEERMKWEAKQADAAQAQTTTAATANTTIR